MTAAKSAPLVAPLTYEAYLREGTIEGSYDIVEGVRDFMPGAIWEHQRIAGNLSDILRHYERTSGKGMALFAPFDVLIRQTPKLQTRQPDILFISHAQLAKGGGVPKKGLLEVAPERVIEIISDSETERRVEAKIQDYIEIGVKECWRVWPETHTIDVLQLLSGRMVVVATYEETHLLQSIAFPDLTFPVAAVFAP